MDPLRCVMDSTTNDAAAEMLDDDTGFRCSVPEAAIEALFGD